MDEKNQGPTYAEIVAARNNRGLVELMRKKESSFSKSRYADVMRAIAAEPTLRNGREIAAWPAGMLMQEYQGYMDAKNKLRAGQPLKYRIITEGKWITQQITSPDQLTPEKYAHRFSYGSIETRFSAVELNSNERAMIQKIVGADKALESGNPISKDTLYDVPRVNGWDDALRTDVEYRVTDKYPVDNSHPLFAENANKGGKRSPIVRKIVYKGDIDNPNSLLRYSESGLQIYGGYSPAVMSIEPGGSQIDLIASFIRHVETP